MNRLDVHSRPAGSGGPVPPRFFISYSRLRPQEADFVENTLRRRGFTVFRDDHSLETGKHITTQIDENIARADIFIVLWCQEYACSPWCFDELDFALARQESGLGILILDLDGTRIVPPKARTLHNQPCRTRDGLAARLTELLDPYV